MYLANHQIVEGMMKSYHLHGRSHITEIFFLVSDKAVCHGDFIWTMQDWTKRDLSHLTIVAKGIFPVDFIKVLKRRYSNVQIIFEDLEKL